MRVVSVKFKEESHVYTSEEFYYMTFLDLSPGEEVIVDTIGKGLQVAMVYCDNIEDERLVSGYVLQRIDKSLKGLWRG